MSQWLKRNRSILLAYALAIALFGVATVFSPGFARGSQVENLLVQASFIALVGLGQTFVIIGGNIDLSIPWTLNGAAVLVTTLAAGRDGPLLWIIPLLLVLGVGVGVVNGFGVAVLGISPIIMTLGMLAILQGALLVYTGGAASQNSPEVLSYAAKGSWGVIRIELFIWIVLTVLASLVLSATSFGRRLYAVGTSRKVAEFSGVNLTSIIVASYVVSALSAVVTGILLTGYVGQSYLGMGDVYLFSSVAAVVIGGASILGGNGHYLGTIAGALTLSVLAGLLPILNLKPAALQIIYGCVILVTVALATIRSRAVK